MNAFQTEIRRIASLLCSTLLSQKNQGDFDTGTYVYFPVQYRHMYQRLISPPSTQSFFLLGPRGSGKSTWLKTHFKKEESLWIDLLVQKTELSLAQDPDSLLEMWHGAGKPKWAVIDEIQKLPALLDVVHRGIEEHKIRFALTGSSARKLRKGHANLLGGRAIEIHLMPFSSLELGKDFKLDQALKFGLLPRLWSDPKMTDGDRSDLLYSYVSTYLREEVAAEQLVRNLDPFRRFLLAAAQCNTEPLNYSKIGRDAGVDSKQVERHFEILGDTLIGNYLEPFHRSVRKRQTAKSKFYFFDTGVVRALTNLAGESLHSSTYEYGKLFESFLINEFYKLRSGLNKRWNFSFLRSEDNAEIDLIVEKPRGKPILVEIKSFTKITTESVASFSRLAKKMAHEEAFLLSNATTAIERDGIRCVNWKEGLKEIFMVP